MRSNTTKAKEHFLWTFSFYFVRKFRQYYVMTRKEKGKKKTMHDDMKKWEKTEPKGSGYFHQTKYSES